MMKLNGQACYSLVRQLLPAMIAKKKGAVVCTSSIASRMTAFMAPYGSEKAKMNALCEALDIELQGTGVTAQAMILGLVITPAVLKFLKPAAADSNTNSSSPEGAAAAAAVATTASPAEVFKPGVFGPSSETAAAAIVRCIGRGGPVVTPYWGHAVSQAMVFGWWPPELQKTMAAAASRKFKARLDRLQGRAA
jgi:short-subunit dehydrogenase